MKPQGHLIASAGLGALLSAKSREPWLFLISLLFGALIDIDHLVDHLHARRRSRVKLSELLTPPRHRSHVIIAFHGFEYLPIVYWCWSFKGRSWAVAATSAMCVHLLADHLVNPLKPLGYFISWRLAHRFRRADIYDPVKGERLRAWRAQCERRMQEGRPTLLDRVLALVVYTSK